MPDRFVLLHISDPHLGAEWSDGDPAARLRAAVAAIRALPEQPDAILLSGDVTDHGEPAEYAAAREELAPLRAPLFALPGNHDGRGPLREAFGLPGGGAERVDYSAELGPLRLVVFDTTVPGEVPAAIGTAALDWLDAELAAAPGLPTVLALHHPPLATGVPAWDAINMSATERAALGEVVARHPQVRAIVGGHLHAARASVLAGRPVIAVPSVLEQAPPDFRAEAQPGFAPYPPHPPGYAVHVLHDDELASRIVSYAP